MGIMASQESSPTFYHVFGFRIWLHIPVALNFVLMMSSGQNLPSSSVFPHSASLDWPKFFVEDDEDKTLLGKVFRSGGMSNGLSQMLNIQDQKKGKRPTALAPKALPFKMYLQNRENIHGGSSFFCNKNVREHLPPSCSQIPIFFTFYQILLSPVSDIPNLF